MVTEEAEAASEDAVAAPRDAVAACTDTVRDVRFGTSEAWNAVGAPPPNVGDSSVGTADKGILLNTI
jgi:hypothetical protein